MVLRSVLISQLFHELGHLCQLLNDQPLVDLELLLVLKRIETLTILVNVGETVADQRKLCLWLGRERPSGVGSHGEVLHGVDIGLSELPLGPVAGDRALREGLGSRVADLRHRREALWHAGHHGHLVHHMCIGHLLILLLIGELIESAVVLPMLILPWVARVLVLVVLIAHKSFFYNANKKIRVFNFGI